MVGICCVQTLGGCLRLLAQTGLVAMFELVPVHFFVSCGCSELIWQAAIVLGLVIGILGIATRRLQIVVLVSVGIALHAVCTH